MKTEAKNLTNSPRNGWLHRTHLWKWMLGSLALPLALISSTTTGRANVYATDINVNGILTSASVSVGSPVTITYRLNQTADRGVKVNILNGNSNVAVLTGGSNLGLNSVVWTPTSSGTFHVSITAGASDVSGGSGNWTQISIDGTNTAAVYPLGMDVDKNTNSPYYGRVVVGCAADGSANGVTQMVGLYKANADGSPADEGAFGYAGYATNDSGNVGVGEMSQVGQDPYHNSNLPGIIRIAGDDRIYFLDDSGYGSVVACDMQATTNQIVINGGFLSLGYPDSLDNYANNPDLYDLNVGGIGWGQFDVAGFETGQPAVYLDDTGDYPGAGVWMYHLVNGAADPNDTVGTQVLAPDNSSIFVTGGGLSVDAKLDIFVSQLRVNDGDPLFRVFAFTNWNGGVLPPEGDGGNDTYAVPGAEAPAWAIGSGNDVLSGINDTVFNSRLNPTLVAVATQNGADATNGYAAYNGGITILSAMTGAVVVTNLDSANWYTSVAFDNVGNIYGCSQTTNFWRVWSPPGPNTNTTLAVATIVVPVQFIITKITASPTTPGCANLALDFTAPGNPAPSTFVVIGSATVNGTYTPVPGVLITGGLGSYQATFSNCSPMFYKIQKVNIITAD